MSGQFSSVMMFVSLMAIAFATNRASEQTLPSEAHRARGLATVHPEDLRKKQILGEFKTAPLFPHTLKVTGPLKVDIQVDGQPPAKIGARFVLMAHVHSTQPLASAQFKWAIPEGVRWISGAQTGTLTDLEPGKAKIVQIVLEKASVENRQVHIHAQGAVGRSRFAAAAQYNTELQTYLDREQQSVKAGIEALQKQSQRPKIHH